MHVQIESRGSRLRFALRRLNYASVHVVLDRSAPDVVMLAGEQTLAPRGVLDEDGELRRLVWVCPPEWTLAFPDELLFAITQDGGAEAGHIARVTGVSHFSRQGVSTRGIRAGQLAPFPPDVVERVNQEGREPYDLNTIWTSEDIDRFVVDLLRLRKMLGRWGFQPSIARYVGFLKRMEAAMEFTLNHFPDVNTTAIRSARYHAIATHPEEMMVMAHHLYVLTSAGVVGNFAEFGCFKGFSTSCLSRACYELGLTMHVFDSFQGLPESASGRYLTGEYIGSLDEVSAHVADFGRSDLVVWHKGFFSETLPSFDDTLSAIWMDVDLAESATDVMQVLPRLADGGCIFSHEIGPDAFTEGRPNEDLLSKGRFEVLPPIIRAVRGEKNSIQGEHLGRSLGVIYRPRSIRVLPFRAIKALLGTA